MYMRSLKDHPNWQEAAREIMKLLDPDLIALVNEIFPAPFPPADIYVTNDEITVIMEIPGWQEKDEFTLSVSENLLEIKGIKKQTQVPSIDARCLSQEIFWGPFTRTITLPYQVDPEKISVKYLNGVLEILLQRLSGENDWR